jgi:hypothetical protein
VNIPWPAWQPQQELPSRISLWKNKSGGELMNFTSSEEINPALAIKSSAEPGHTSGAAEGNPEMIVWRSRYCDWLRNSAAMEPQDRREFTELRKSSLKTARAWALAFDTNLNVQPSTFNPVDSVTASAYSAFETSGPAHLCRHLALRQVASIPFS